MLKSAALTRMSLLAGLLVLAAAACSQSTGGQSGDGGATGSGGAAQGSGGAAPGTGGGSASGGSVGSGGAGVKGSGGTGGTGAIGTTSSGGGNGAGVVSGGTDGGGGALAGGAPGTGGSQGLGGSAASGGVGAAAGSGAGGRASGGSVGGAKGGAGSGGSAGVTCPVGSSKPAEGKKTLMVGTASRSYYLHIPAKYDGTKPVPLVVDFHGLGGTGTSEASSNPYKSVIDPEGVVSAYPDGANGTNGTGWNLGACCTSADDVGFARALVQDVEKMACIDPKRVYAVGYSLGGGMVEVLACKAADVFAAASPAAADLVDVDTCTPARPITVFTFRGTADTAVPYGGGTVMGNPTIGAQASFQKWATIDQCTGSPSTTDSNGCSTYSSCAGNVQVTLCTKQGGGHDPGTATVSWPMLKKYALP